jgi:cysteinyl-tRNA synthetase
MNFESQKASQEILELIRKSENARKLNNWQEADLLREQLARLNVEVLDTPQNTIWHFK